LKTRKEYLAAPKGAGNLFPTVSRRFTSGYFLRAPSAQRQSILSDLFIKQHQARFLFEKVLSRVNAML
jgi:hypothetical protein